MKRILINGSPRGDKSNSTIMLKWFREGYGEDLPVYNINLENHHKKAKEAFLESDEIFIIMPVYCDSMPAQVMRFFEYLEYDKESLKGKRVSAFIHLGFPEGAQAYPLKRILENVFKELHLECKEIIIRGGSEPTRFIPENYQKKNIEAIQALGKAFKEDKPFPRKSVEHLGNPMVLSKKQKFFMTLGDWLGFSHMHWNKQLKANGVLEKSFDTPYVDVER